MGQGKDTNTKDMISGETPFVYLEILTTETYQVSGRGKNSKLRFP